MSKAPASTARDHALSLPTIAERREAALAELRIVRLNEQLIVAHLDFIGASLNAGFIAPESVPLMVAELLGTAEEAAE